MGGTASSNEANNTYASKVAYHLLSEPVVTPDVLQAPHRHWVREQLQQPGTYLLEDTTQLYWALTARPRTGLGPVETNRHGEQGVLLHSVVATRREGCPPTVDAPRPAVAVLLDHHHHHVRQPVPAAQRRAPQATSPAGPRQ